nr:magnesium chelatase subunit D [Polymorphobacter sp.]
MNNLASLLPAPLPEREGPLGSAAMGDPSATRWHLAQTAITLLVAAPNLGGLLLRARPGPVRDAWTPLLVAQATLRRLPASADAEALDGGLDLTATLAAGRPIHRPGILRDIGTGILLIPMAERLSPSLAARLATALDEEGPRLVLFDESDPDTDEQVAPALADRLAIHLDLTDVRLPMAILLADAIFAPPETAGVGGGNDTSAIPDSTTALTTAADTLGIASIRAPIQAQRLAHAHAALNNRTHITAADLEIAAALVLGPRATRLPPGETPPPPQESPDEHPPEPPPPSDEGPDNTPQETPQDLTDLVLDAAETALPPGLLDALASGKPLKSKGNGRSGAKLRSLTSGRPAGVRTGAPGRGARLAIIETIKAAAPWQSVRSQRLDGRLNIRHDDLRIRRFVARTESTTIFTVDASGSAAFARLSESKGAVELLLAQAYVKRAEVALIAFRGDTAEISLPPTRSLARAKRQLAALAGGGGTPMAAGLDLARRLAESERARGRTPLVVVLTDGRANVGGTDKLTPQEAALTSARAFAATGLASVFIDCSARPRPEGSALATAMSARYVALPRMDARSVVAAVNAAT